MLIAITEIVYICIDQTVILFVTKRGVIMKLIGIRQKRSVHTAQCVEALDVLISINDRFAEINLKIIFEKDKCVNSPFMLFTTKGNVQQSLERATIPFDYDKDQVNRVIDDRSYLQFKRRLSMVLDMNKDLVMYAVNGANFGMPFCKYLTSHFNDVVFNSRTCNSHLSNT